MKNLERGKNKLIEKQAILNKQLFNSDQSDEEEGFISKRRKIEEDKEIEVEADGKQITKKDFEDFNWTKCQKLLFLSRTLCCGHSLCIQWTYEWLLKNFTCPTWNEKVNLEEIIETLQIHYFNFI